MQALVNHLRISIFATIMILGLSNGWAEKIDTLRYRQLPGYPFVYVSDAYVSTPPAISDSLFDMVARGIRFRVNRTELLEDDPFITLYNDSLVPLLKQQNLVLRQVFVKGAASPEGPYWNNIRLSRERTKRLIEFLKKRGVSI